VAGDHRSVLEILEGAAVDDPSALPVQLAYLAAPGVGIEEDELGAALRRALLVQAAGGDPHREPTPDAPAAVELAADLSTPARRTSLGYALAALRHEAHGLPLVTAAVEALMADPETAWLLFACALLADELAGP
jgi:hypothetical protein